MSLDLVATCALGLEEFLQQELDALGAARIRSQKGAVTFAGSWRDVYRANWCLRTANRVLVELGSWDGSTAESLAQGAARIVARDRDWDGLRSSRLLDPRHTLVLRSTSTASRIRDTRWINLKVKDGLVDAQRRRFGRRSSIDKRNPDTCLRVWLFEDRATLLLDTSGEPLDRRGYRVETTEAPVRECLAAACVLASGWDGLGPVVDPMCGSGTLLAEAASLALGLAPGRMRSRWAFERLPNFRREVWQEVRKRALPAAGDEMRLYGIDRSEGAIEAAAVNLERAGLADRVELRVGDGYEFRPPRGPGLLAINPAYGERLTENREQWPRLGDLMKQHYKGWRAVVLAGGEGMGKHIGLRPSRRIPVRNGPLEARILPFELY